MGEMTLEKRKLALDIIERAVAKCVETGTDDVAIPLMDAIVVMEAASTAALVHPRPAVPEGWKLVPLEPTSPMTFIGQTLRYDSVNSIGEIYRRMLAAAPESGGG